MLSGLADFIDNVSDHHFSSALFAVSTGFIFGAVDTLFEAQTSKGHVRCPHVLLRASAIGATAGGTAILLLHARQQRRKLIVDELERLSQLNHRLRNALQIIADSHYFEPNETHRKMMFETVGSMDAALQQLIPAFGKKRQIKRAA